MSTRMMCCVACGRHSMTRLSHVVCTFCRGQRKQQAKKQAARAAREQPVLFTRGPA